VSGDGWQAVGSIAELEACLAEWDGQVTPPETWLKATEAAQAAADEEVREMQARAAEREHRALIRQVEAARLRLTRELGRYLVCLDEGTGDLNDILHRQISRDLQGAARLRECYERLGGYPQWDAEALRDLESYEKNLPEDRRRARLMGSELQAALDDPRWAALDRTETEEGAMEGTA
jgi:hypothetical protein